MIKYPFAERFKAPQGEGLYSGTMMAFARLVGCSVGQGVCTACDTEFDRVRVDLGGGLFTAEEIATWAGGCERVCLTGGEPMDRAINPLIGKLNERGHVVHVETSGTKSPGWLEFRRVNNVGAAPGRHYIMDEHGQVKGRNVWLTVSPKPGYLESMVDEADEVKVILGGLGDGPGWPGIEDAVRWANQGKLVYVQPRNGRNEVDMDHLKEALEVVATFPRLRLSCQLHKFVRTR